MPRKYFRKFLPAHETVKRNRWIRPFGAWLQRPNLWHLNRRSTAGGVAVGLFCGLIPGPFQMIGAAILSILFRVNLPVALFTTLYTNPLTIVPLYVWAYEIGALLGGAAPMRPAVPEMGWTDWYSVLPTWILSLGKPLAIGLPVLACALAAAGYLIVRALWYWAVMREWRKRAARRKGGAT